MIIAPVLSQPFIIMYAELSMYARKLLYFINNIIIQIWLNIKHHLSTTITVHCKHHLTTTTTVHGKHHLSTTTTVHCKHHWNLNTDVYKHLAFGNVPPTKINIFPNCNLGHSSAITVQ